MVYTAVNDTGVTKGSISIASGLGGLNDSEAESSGYLGSWLSIFYSVG
jgi:hypothetical protein